jgi:hypothetical protein
MPYSFLVVVFLDAFESNAHRADNTILEEYLGVACELHTQRQLAGCNEAFGAILERHEPDWRLMLPQERPFISALCERLREGARLNDVAHQVNVPISGSETGQDAFVG